MWFHFSTSRATVPRTARQALYRIRQLDDVEFEKARTMNTIGSYEQYITLFPEGAGVELARQQIATFRVKAQKEEDLRRQLDQAREERKLLEEELRRKTEVATIVPPPPPVGGTKWGGMQLRTVRRTGSRRGTCNDQLAAQS
jgi:hypothetical protein